MPIVASAIPNRYMTKQLLTLLIVFAAITSSGKAAAEGRITLNPDGRLPAIVHEDQAAMKIAGDLLARDLAALGGGGAARGTGIEACTRVCVVIGRHDSPLVRKVLAEEGIELPRLEWESYERIAIESHRHPGMQILLIPAPICAVRYGA